MADDSPDESNKSSEDIIVTASRHPAETRSTEIGVDGKIGVNLPCPINKIGPVSLTCGAGIDTFDLGAYAQVRGSMPLHALVPVDAVKGFRVIAQISGNASAGGISSTSFVGVASPPVHGVSVRAGVDPMNGQPRVGILTRF